jgi:hypothetical protein
VRPIQALEISRSQRDYIHRAEATAGNADIDPEKASAEERYIELKQRLAAILWGETAPHLNIGEEYVTPAKTVTVSKDQDSRTLIGCRLRCQIGVPATRLTRPNSPDITIITAEWAHYPSEEHQEQAFKQRSEPREQFGSEPNPGGIYATEMIYEAQVLHPPTEGADQWFSSVESTLTAYELA